MAKIGHRFESGGWPGSRRRILPDSAAAGEGLLAVVAGKDPVEDPRGCCVGGEDFELVVGQGRIAERYGGDLAVS